MCKTTMKLRRLGAVVTIAAFFAPIMSSVVRADDTGCDPFADSVPESVKQNVRQVMISASKGGVATFEIGGYQLKGLRSTQNECEVTFELSMINKKTPLCTELIDVCAVLEAEKEGDALIDNYVTDDVNQ